MVSGISSFTPSLSLASPMQMIKNLKLIALPAIALVSATHIAKADALMTWGCVWCLASGVGLPACWFPCGVAIVTSGIAPLF